MSVNVENKRIVKNTFFLYLRMVVVLFANLYTSRIVLQNLGIQDFGIYNVVASFVTLFSFFNVSLSNGIQRFYNYAMGKGDNDNLKNVFSAALFIHLILALFVFFIASVVGQIYIDNVMVVPENRIYSAKIIYEFALISFCFTLVQIPFSAIVIAFEKMNFFAIVGLFEAVFKLLIAFAIAFVNWDKLEFYVFLLMMISFLNFVLYFLYSKHITPYLKFDRSFSKNIIGELICFSGWNAVGTFSFTIRSQGVNLLLNAFFGPIVNAANGIANQVMSAVNNFSVTILTAFRPQIIQSYAKGDFVRFQKLFFTETKAAYFLSLVIALPLFIEMDYVLGVWLGESFIPEYTSSFTRFVLILMMLSPFHQPLTHAIHANGSQKVFQITNLFFMTLVIPTSYLFLCLGTEPRVVYIVSIVMKILDVFFCILVVYGKIKFDIKRYVKEVVMPCFILTIFLPFFPFILSYLMNQSFLRFLLVSFSEILIAFAIIYLFLLDKYERSSVKNFFKKRLHI